MNTATFLIQAATRHPDGVAIRHGDTTLTYRQFADRAGKIAGSLQGLGLDVGDRVGIVQRNGPELLETLYGALLAGLVVVPVNMRLHPREVAYIAVDSGCKALIHTEEFNSGLKDVEADIPGLLARISTRPTTGELNYEDCLMTTEPLTEAVDVKSDAVCWLFYTSGTTGRPKGVMWSQRTVHNLILGYLADVYSLQSDDVVLHAAPLSHGSGTVALSCVARAAENLILHSRSFDPAVVFDLIERHRVTVIAFLAPTQIVKLLEEFVPGRHDLSSLRCLLYGGAPMYLEHLTKALESFGPILVQIFGQGESPLTISYLSAPDHDRFWKSGHDRLGSAGIPRTGIEIRIADEKDKMVPVGTTGEILVRGEIVMPGYWRNKEATAEALQGDWLHTGDVGRVDEKGYLYVLDRSKDMVISGGNNIYPREIEEVLVAHPAVAECAVIGVPDDYWGESLHAFVTLNQGYNVPREELIAYCGANLASYKKPRTIEFREALPKNAYGKVDKRVLSQPYWQGRERRVGGGTLRVNEGGGTEQNGGATRRRSDRGKPGGHVR